MEGVIANRILEGRTCLVTGAASGIGKAIVDELARQGANVVALDLDEANLARVSQSITASGGRSLCVKADVTDVTSLRDAVAVTMEEFGRLDVFFNNAGISMPTPLADITRETFEKIFAVNVYGVLAGSQVAAEVMRGQSGISKIINTCSCVGKKGTSQASIYSGSKFAVRGITQSLALELAPHGITVNAFCPGIVDTPLWDPIGADLVSRGVIASRDALLANRGSQIPLGYISTPEHLLGTAVFLASAASDYMTGQAINIDGGMNFD